MEEDESELLGTEERLEQFAVEYGKLPVLWSKEHKDFRNKSARVAALRRLARALGRTAADPHAKRMNNAVRQFRYRQQQEVLSACAEASLRGGGGGALLPRWARRADAYLRLLPAPEPPREQEQTPVTAPPPPKASKKNKCAGEPLTGAKLEGELSRAGAAANAAAKQQLDTHSRLAARVVRGMRHAARRPGGRGLGRAACARVAERLGERADTVLGLWTGMQRLCVNKLRARVWRSDTGPPLAAIEWAVIDLVVIYGGPILNMMHYQHYRSLRGLLATFHLVQRFGLEPLPGEPPPSPQQWVRAAHWYSRDQSRAATSALVLQRRWHELRADTRRRLQAAWRGEGEPDARDRVLALHEAIARRYPHVVTGTLPTWGYMQHTNQLAPPTTERGPVPGAVEYTEDPTDFRQSDPSLPCLDDDGVIVIDDENQTTPSADKTNAQSDSKETAKAQKTKPKQSPTEKPERKDLQVANFAITDSDDNEDLEVQKNVEPVKPEADKDVPIANYDITDSDEDLHIDESRDPSEDVIHALQKLDPRAVQATIVFASDEDDASNDAGRPQHTDNEIENVEEPKDNKYSGETGEAIEGDAHSNSKNKAFVKAVDDDNESHTSVSKKAAKRRSDSSDSGDGILVIDDDNEDLSDDLISADKTLVKTDVAHDDTKKQDQITASIEEEMLKDTSNVSSKYEVESRVDDSTVKLPSENSNSKANETTHQNPLLSQLLTSIPDDVKVYKRFQAIKARDKEAKRLEKINHNSNAVATTSKIDEYAMNIRNELQEIASASDEENCEFEGGIDPKLLMCPVVLLTKLEDVLANQLAESKPKISPPPTTKLSPKLLANKRHIDVLSTLSESFFSIRRNIEQLKLCKPCVVMLDVRERWKRSRVSKRVELPDIEEVRRNNKSLLTAQVAPLAHQRSTGAKGAAAAEGAGGVPSLEELEQLLDAFAGAPPAHALCKNRNPAAGSGSGGPCGCGRCASAALAAPPASPAAAQLQSRLLRRAANDARQLISMGKERKPAVKKKPEPPPPPVRPPSPYDAERATREWLREKNVAAEKFGLKPRSFKKPAPAGSAALPPLPPLPAPAPPPSLPGAVLTLNTAGQHILNTDLRNQQSHYVVDRESSVNQPPKQSTHDAPVRPSDNPACLPVTEESLLRRAQNQPIYKLAPDLFNVNAVADINKKLGDLASSDQSNTETSVTPIDQGFSPIITNVLSLAPEDRSKTKNSNVEKSTNSAVSRKDPRAPARPIVTMTRGQPQNVPKLVLNKSQLKTLPVIPADTSHPLSPLNTQAVVSDAQPHSLNTSNASGFQVSQGMPQAMDGTILRAGQTELVSANTVQVNSVNSGLQSAPWAVSAVQPAMPGIVVGPASTISQSTFEMLPRHFGVNPQSSLQVNSVQAGPSQAQTVTPEAAGSQLQLVLTPQQFSALQAGYQLAVMQGDQQTATMQVDRQSSALQVSAVRSAPAKTASPQATLQNRQVGSPQTAPLKSPQLGVMLTNEQISNLRLSPQVSIPQGGTVQASVSQISAPQVIQQLSLPQVSAPHTLQQVSVSQASAPQALQQVSVLQISAPQVSAPHTLQQVSVSQASAPQALQQVSVSQVSVPQALQQVSVSQVSFPQALQQVSISQVSVPQVSAPQANASYVVLYAGASGNKRKMEYVDEVFNEDWPGLRLPSPVAARNWVAGGRGGDRAALAVLAAARGCWPLWRVANHLVLREPSALAGPRPPVYALSPLLRLLLPDEEEEDGPTEPKQSNVAASSGPGPAPRPYLKVKAFAKMTDDSDAREPASQPERGLTTPPRLLVGDKVYLKLCDAPLAYAKVLSPVSGLRECGAALLRRSPLYLYSPYTASLAPLTGELNASGSAIVLTGAADMSVALGLLARMLNPSDAEPEPPTAPPPDPPADEPVVNVTKPKIIQKPSKPKQEPALKPKVLNQQSCDDVLVEAVQVASDPDTQTYHLVLNHLKAGSVTRARRVEGEARVLGGVIDLSSDEELSV